MDLQAPVGLTVSGHVHAGQTFPLHPLVWYAQKVHKDPIPA